jgi:hypothetical protein
MKSSAVTHTDTDTDTDKWTQAMVAELLRVTRQSLANWVKRNDWRWGNGPYSEAQVLQIIEYPQARIDAKAAAEARHRARMDKMRQRFNL